MPRITLILGIVLIGLGVGLYLGSGRESVTALIPAFFGAAFVLLGLWARSEKWRKHAMHVAAVLSVLGIGGTAKGLIGGIRHLAGTEAERPMAVLGQSVMCVLCVLFLGLCVRSFIQARKAQAAENA